MFNAKSCECSLLSPVLVGRVLPRKYRGFDRTEFIVRPERYPAVKEELFE